MYISLKSQLGKLSQYTAVKGYILRSGKHDDRSPWFKADS